MAVTLAVLLVYLVRALVIPDASRTRGASFLSPLFNWDGGWYFRITASGYHQLPGTPEQPYPFFPLLPAATAAAHTLLPFLELHVAGMVVALGSVCAAMLVVDAAIDAWPEWQRLAMVALLLVVPGGFQYATFMSETLFVLAVALVVYGLLREKQEWVAGAGVALATLGRPNGVVLFVPLVLVLAQRQQMRSRAALMAVGIALSGLAAVFALYLVVSGDPLRYMSAHQEGWNYARGLSYAAMIVGRRADSVAALVSQALARPGSYVAITASIWEGLLVVPLVALSWRWNRAMGLVAGSFWIFILAVGGFESHMRYLLVCLPLWIAPLALYRQRWQAWAVAGVLGAAGLAFNWYLVGEFAAGRWAS